MLTSYFHVYSFSYVPPLFLPTKLDEAPIPNGIITDFAPSLHRLWLGGS